MTCKDCFHYSACKSQIPKSYWQDDYIDGCKHFKDKNKIIELPCKVGDTIYEIVRLKGATPKILEETVDNVYPYGQTIKKTNQTQMYLQQLNMGGKE